jgi:4'-phosphopantetheinyl transferase
MAADTASAKRAPLLAPEPEARVPLTRGQEQIGLDCQLGHGEVHVWSAGSPADHVGASDAWAVLSPDERAMALRLRNADDRARRVQARAARRRLLAHYVGADPGGLCFREGRDGKPELVARPGRPGVRFNVSHSGSVVLIAVAADCELGVDVERIQTGFPWEQVADASLASEELAAIRELSAPFRLRAFFDCWVRKEAYLKGLGTGLSRSPRDVVVPLDPSGGAVHDASPLNRERSRWWVHPLAVGRDYAAALAVAGDIRITCRSLAQLVP